MLVRNSVILGLVLVSISAAYYGTKSPLVVSGGCLLLAWVYWNLMTNWR